MLADAGIVAGKQPLDGSESVGVDLPGLVYIESRRTLRLNMALRT